MRGWAGKAASGPGRLIWTAEGVRETAAVRALSRVREICALHVPTASVRQSAVQVMLRRVQRACGPRWEPSAVP